MTSTEHAFKIHLDTYINHPVNFTMIPDHNTNHYTINIRLTILNHAFNICIVESVAGMFLFSLDT